MRNLPAGVYRHYKGPLYQVLGYGHDSNHEGRVVVVYIGLQLDDAKTGPRLAVRTVEDFWARVYADGEVCRGPDFAFTSPRFEYVGPSWQGRQP